MIDATFGLGEALVSGQVEPDHYVIDTLSNKIVNKNLGEKKISTRGKPGGGVEVIEQNAESWQALSDEDIRRLAGIGAQIQREYGFPQDIEWALAEGKLYILQSRAITSLYPLPKESFDPLIIWFSFGAVQGILSAITPLGQDMLRMFVSGAGKLFGAQIRYYETDVLVPAGERLWIKISDIMHNPLGRRVYKNMLGFVEPSVGQIVRGLAEEPHLGASEGHLKFNSLRAVLGFLLPILARAAGTVHDPERARVGFNAFIETQLIQPRITGDDKFSRLAQRLQFMEERATATLYKLLPRFAPVLGPTIASLALLTRITSNDKDAQTDHGISTAALEVTRGLPNNGTTEMDLALWSMAKNIRTDSDSLNTFLACRRPNACIPLFEWDST